MDVQTDFPKWYELAVSEIGVQELPKNQHNKRILDYHATTTLQARSDEVPWCSAFVNWCMIQSGIKGTNLANARSWLDWGHELNEPRIGCLVVLTRGPNPAHGHVAFFSGFDGDNVNLLGGNQNNKVGYKLYPRDSILSFRWPFKVVG